MSEEIKIDPSKTQIPTTRFRTVQRLLHTNLSTFLTKEPRSIRSLYCIIAYPCQNVKRNLGFNKDDDDGGNCHYPVASPPPATSSTPVS